MKFHQYWGYWFSVDHVSQQSEIAYVGSGERVLLIDGSLLPQLIYSMVSPQNLCFLWILGYLFHSSWRYQFVAKIFQISLRVYTGEASLRGLPTHSLGVSWWSTYMPDKRLVSEDEVILHSACQALFPGMDWLIFSWTKYYLIKLYVLGRNCPKECPWAGCRYRPAAFGCLEALLPSI